jgi:protein O-GlcNAc transferase
MEFNVTTICPQDDVHALNLHAYAKVVAAGLHSNGYSVQCEPNKIDDNKKNVILGAHLLDPSEHSRIPSGSIIVNLEQLMAKGAPVSKAYLDLLQRHVVWDYSKNNMEFLLSRFGVKHAQYLPVSYHESMMGLENKRTQDIDVLFYGVLNARRRAILTALDEAGLNVQVLVGVYGDERDEYISKSKVVLSVSYYAVDILESTRVLDAMAKGKAVVAECSENADFDPRMRGGAVLCGYDDLVAECKRLVADSESRRSVESKALKTCCALDVSKTVEDVLNALGLAERELLEHSQDVSRPEVTDLEASVSQMLELSNAGDTFEAERLAVAIIGKNPSVPEAWNIIGAAAAQKDELSEAQMAFQCVVSLLPESATGHENLGRVLLAGGKLEESLSYIARAFELEPGSLRVGELLAQLLNRTEQFDRALDLGEDLLIENPKSKCLILEMARACRGLNRIDPACQLYLAAVACDLSDAEVQAELAVYFYENGRIKDAIAFYADVLDRDKLDVHAYHGLGTCYHFMGHLETALEFYEQVLQLQPGMPGTLRNISHVYHVLVRPAEAIEAVSKVVSRFPDDFCAKVQLAYYKKHVCDWSDQMDFSAIEDLSALNGASPFQVLPMVDDPVLQLELAKHYQANTQHVCEKPTLPNRQDNKIRVGFFGSDFHEHATLVLMSGMFREYDKARFEFFVYSYGVSKVSAYRAKVEEQVDVFRDLEGWTDGEIVDVARADQLDIAIDLKGFTNTGRLEPFEIGIAPIQISYLGYPGTVGRDCFDYMVADDITVPSHLEHGYSEQIMSMPNAYQPNDCNRPLVFRDDKRQDHGLPEKGFVFCCFNNNYKISPEEFDIWMRLLSAVEGSVLWLLDANEFVRANLTREAEKRGISADRLIFAPRVPVAEHLSRHQHADLFLDTFNVNAHTTTSDALWAGLPVLTKLGEQFAARVSGSLLHAAELPELVCETLEQYEATALRLATDETAIAAIRQRLIDNKAQTPLFDTALYMRHFEALLAMAVTRSKEGVDPSRLELGNSLEPSEQSAA